jgi:hypothetical protein
LQILRSLVEKIVVHHNAGNFEVQTVGEIAGMVEISFSDNGKPPSMKRRLVR